MRNSRPAGSLPSDPFSLADMEEYIAAGHKEVAPVYLKEEGTGLLAVRGAHGIYRLAIHADGRIAALFSADPQAMTGFQHKDPAFRDRVAPGFYLDQSRMKQIEVVEGRKQRTHEKWFLEAIHRHGYHYNDHRMEYGYLKRLSQNIWTSDGVVYVADPLPLKHKDYDPQQEKFLLRCYTSSGRGVSIADMGEKLRDGNLGWMRKLGARKCVVNADDLEPVIRDDFFKRSLLLSRNRDPGKLGRMRKEPELSSPLSPPARKLGEIALRDVKHFSNRTVQHLERQIRQIRAQYVAMGFVKTLLLSTVQVLLKGVRAGAVAMVMGLVQPLAELIKRVPIIDRLTKDIADTLWETGHSIRNGTQHYCRIALRPGMLMRYLGYDEAGVTPVNGAKPQGRLPANWAEDHIIDLLDSPSGSIVELRDFAGEKTIYVEQPDGLAVQYVLGREIAYATYRPELRQPMADPLPQPVAELLKAKGPTVKIFSDANGQRQSVALDPEQVSADMMREVRARPSTFSLRPAVSIDMSRLQDLAEDAYPVPPKQSIVRQGVSLCFNGVSYAARKIGVMAPEQENIPPARRALEEQLRNRGPF